MSFEDVNEVVHRFVRRYSRVPYAALVVVIGFIPFIIGFVDKLVVLLVRLETDVYTLLVSVNHKHTDRGVQDQIVMQSVELKKAQTLGTAAHFRFIIFREIVSLHF